MSDSLRSHELQHNRLPCPSPSPRAYSNSYPLSCDAIQPSNPLFSPSPLALNLSQHHGLFQWVGSSHQVAKVLELQLLHQFNPCHSWRGVLCIIKFMTDGHRKAMILKQAGQWVNCGLILSTNFLYFSGNYLQLSGQNVLEIIKIC